MSAISVSRDAIARKSFVEFGTERLLALCGAIGVARESNALLDVFERLVLPWGKRPMGDQPRYRSNISDDEAPFEFCIAISNGMPEVQVYVEAQGEPPTIRSNMEAGRALLEAVASDLGAPLDRLRQLEPFFFPEAPMAPFTTWIGASWTVGGAVKLKVYLNPQVRGGESALGLVGEALGCLGFGRSWATVREMLLPVGTRRDEASILSLDLSESARVKVYLRHHRATVKELDAFARLTAGYNPGDVDAFYSALAGNGGPFLKKPALTEMVFVDPSLDRPSSATLEFPIGSYVENDEVASERIRRCLETFSLSSDSYDKAIRAFATRPLREGPGIHAHVTLRRDKGAPRIAVYLASETYVSARG